MLLVLLAACFDIPADSLAELPPDWTDAEPIADFTQRECEGSAYDSGIGPAVVSVEEANAGLAVDVGPVGFRCAQDVEGFWLADGSAVSVLVQPVDMNPSEVAGCDCLYDLSMTIPSSEGETVAIWTRGDNMSGREEPELEAEGGLEAE